MYTGHKYYVVSSFQLAMLVLVPGWLRCDHDDDDEF